MRSGVQYQGEMQIKDIKEAGFPWTEVAYPQISDLNRRSNNVSFSGIVIKIEDLLTCDFSVLTEYAVDLKIHYLVVDTEKFDEADKLDLFIEQRLSLFQRSSFSVYIENGYSLTENNSCQCNNFSEISYLREIVNKYNELCGTEKFGLCLNVGHANLLGKNLQTFVEEAGEQLKLIHMNDNGGLHDDHQMPLTFTKGRGTRTTDIFRLIGVLCRTGYDGWLIFDVKGLFARSPECLHKNFLQLLRKLTDEWEDQLLLEKKLNQPEKELILFGTGKMAQNYMTVWGEKYLPVFMIDNNSALWGQERYGVCIRKPEDILEIPESQRNVFICNRFYDAIGDQLKKMGITYQCYNDNYYM